MLIRRRAEISETESKQRAAEQIGGDKRGRTCALGNVYRNVLCAVVVSSPSSSDDRPLAVRQRCSKNVDESCSVHVHDFLSQFHDGFAMEGTSILSKE